MTDAQDHNLQSSIVKFRPAQSSSPQTRIWQLILLRHWTDLYLQNQRGSIQNSLDKVPLRRRIKMLVPLLLDRQLQNLRDSAERETVDQLEL